MANGKKIALNRRSDRSFCLCVLGLRTNILLWETGLTFAQNLQQRYETSWEDPQGQKLSCQMLAVSGFWKSFRCLKAHPSQPENFEGWHAWYMFWVLGRSISMQYTQTGWHVYRCKHVYPIFPFHSNLMLETCGSEASFMMNMYWICMGVYQMSIFLYQNSCFSWAVWRFDVDGEVSNKPPRSWSTWMVNYLPHCRSPSCHPSTERRGSQPTTNNRWLNFLTYLVGC